MEREKRDVFLQMTIGLLLMTIANAGYWQSTWFLWFIASVAMGLVGFFLATSKMLVFYEAGFLRDPRFLLAVGGLIFLFVSFFPFWCFEIFNVAEGWKTCSYINFWEFFFLPK